MKNVLKPFYLATFSATEIYNAGIVRLHQDSIMNSMGYHPLQFTNGDKNGFLVKCIRFKQFTEMVFSVPKNSIVYFHFPFQAYIEILLHRYLHWRGIKTVALIIDIDGLRDKKEQLLKKELDQLAKFTHVVAHNGEMKKWLSRHLPSASIFDIAIFDYPTSYRFFLRKLSPVICFAGNLSKANFVYNCSQVKGVLLQVYGPGYDETKNNKKGILYKGILQPNALMLAMEGSFGLVWDGDDVDNCDLYLMYNNPHKVSLYLAAGMPIIVWEKSAIAAWVKENNIGFCINSILETGNCISNISSQEYESMCKNVAAISRQICDGYYLKSVIKKIKVS